MATEVIGNSFSLAQWFQQPVQASGPEDDFLREDILADAYRFTEYGVQNGVVILRTPRGRTIVETEDYQGSKIVTFDHVERDRWHRVRFWFNHSTVANLGDHLRAAGDRRRPFDTLFLND